MINNMEKRGQVYILAAVIIGVLLFTIFATVNTSKQVDLNANFDRLNENYERESERFINTYVSDNSPTDELEDTFPIFTRDFNNFARETNPEFGIISTLSFTKKDGTKINLVVNMLDTPIFVTTKSSNDGVVFTPSKSTVDVVIGCSEISEGGIGSPIGGVNTEEAVGNPDVTVCTYKITDPGADKVFLFVNDIWVGYEIPKKIDPKPGLIVTAKSDEGEQIQIFVNENEIPIDNSKGNKVKCSEICNFDVDNEDDCKTSGTPKEQKCCKFVNNNPPKNDKCDRQKCCRVNCKIFKIYLVI